MPVVCTRHRDNVDQTSCRAPEFRIEITGENLNLANGAFAEIERNEEFCFGKIGPCLERIGAIDESIRVEVIHTAKIRSGFRVAIAGLGRTGNEYPQIQKFSAAHRQVVDEAAV